MANPEYTTGTISVSEQELKFYYITKPGNGRRRMLWLHGWGLGPEYNMDILDTISNYVDIIAPDMNTIRLPSRLGEQAKLLHKFWKKVDNNRCYLAGYSYGGLQAMYFAAYSHYPLDDIVLINPAIRPKKNGPIRLILHGAYKNFKETAGIQGLKASLLNFKLFFPFAGTIASSPRRFYRRLQSMYKRKYNIKIKKRVGLIRSKDDEYFDYNSSDSQKLLRIQIPKLEEIVEENQTGHSWPLMDPDKASDEILSYLTG